MIKSNPLTREQRRDFRVILRGFGVPMPGGLPTSEEWDAAVDRLFPPRQSLQPSTDS